MYNISENKNVQISVYFVRCFTGWWRCEQCSHHGVPGSHQQIPGKILFNLIFFLDFYHKLIYLFAQQV